MARELDDAILHLRANEPELGIIVFRSEGDDGAVLAADALLERHPTTGWCAKSASTGSAC
jgi:benzoyl-CoA-dihydrodiol lyase